MRPSSHGLPARSCAGRDLASSVPGEERRGGVAPDAKRHGQIRSPREGEQERAGERVSRAERVRPVDRSHLDAHELTGGRGDGALAPELDAGDAIPACESERRLLRVEPGQRPRLVGVREEEVRLRGRPEEAIDAERLDEARRRSVDADPGCTRTIERRARSGRRARLQERVAGHEDGPSLERLGEIIWIEAGARAGIGDDRRAADDDDAAGALGGVEREQGLDTGRNERLRHEPPGSIRADPADHRGPRAEPGGRERGVGGGPARAQLDPAVDASARNRCRERPVEHDVADGDQVVRHVRRIPRYARGVIAKAPFGSTGHESTRTLFGAAALGSVTQAEADRTLDVLSQHGVNHIDTAASYGDSELRLAPWLTQHRERFFVATKTGQRDRAGAREELHRSLERLGVDQVDLLQLHNLVDVIEWETALREGGALEAAVEARDEGLVRFIGVTGHGLTVARMHLRSLERFPFDSVLLPYSYIQMRDDRYSSDFEVLAALCSERNVAMQTIKAITLAPWDGREQTTATWYEPLRDQDDIDLAVHWVLGRPGVFLNTVGDVALLPKVLDAASRFEARPADQAMNELAARRHLVPLFS